MRPLLQPKVEIMIADRHDDGRRPPGGKIASSVAVATRSDGRVLNGGKRQRHEICDVGEEVQADDDHRAERGGERRHISSRFFDLARPWNVMLFQASLKKSEPVLRDADRDEQSEGGRRLRHRA